MLLMLTNGVTKKAAYAAAAEGLWKHTHTSKTKKLMGEWVLVVIVVVEFVTSREAVVGAGTGEAAGIYLAAH